MNKGFSKSLLVCMTILLVSFYIGATSSSEDLSMAELLSYNGTEYAMSAAVQASDGIYDTLLSEENNNKIEAELTVTSNISSVANAMYEATAETVDIGDNTVPTSDNPSQGNGTDTDTTTNKFETMAIAIVDTYVNVRKSASESADIVGKMYNGAFANIVTQSGDWTQIKSGTVEGYVKSSFLIKGEDVKNSYKNYIEYIGVATVNSLNIRSEKSTSAVVVTTINKGAKCTVIDQTDNNWVLVKINGKKGYVAKEYVEISLDYKKAISIKEEAELQKASAEGMLNDAASAVTTTYGSKTSIDSADMRLLVCLVFCESGAEPYEGKLAVANVVLNRYHSGRFPNTIKGVIYQSGQFSPTWNGQMNKKLALYDRGGFTAANHLEAIKAVKAALDGTNNIGSRLYFNGYNYEKNRGHSNAIRISNHLFW